MLLRHDDDMPLGGIQMRPAGMEQNGQGLATGRVTFGEWASRFRDPPGPKLQRRAGPISIFPARIRRTGHDSMRAGRV
jgi:hypothetical protein